MSDELVDHLEREVEQARSRVAGDLARLRDPKAMSDLNLIPGDVGKGPADPIGSRCGNSQGQRRFRWR
jgi:hypothetical protein